MSRRWCLLAILLMSIVAFLYFLFTKSTLLYFDSKAHLQIARQVIDGLTPGLAQLGGVWLPLFHFLMLPLIWIDPLYRLGIPGSIISMASFILSSILIFKLSTLILKDIRSALLSTAVFSLNPNMLYMQSIPMTESLYILTFISSLYFLARWVIDRRHRDLLLSALCVFFASLTRYEGWSLIPLYTIVIIVVSLRRNEKHDKGRTEGLTVAFLSLASFGVILWIIWCFVIFGDPLYFIFGEYSAHQCQVKLHQAGLLPTKGNLPLCISQYLLASARNSGEFLYLIFIASLIAFILKRRLTLSSLPPYLLLFPAIFHITSLYLGHTVLLVPKMSGINTKEIFNARYGLMMLPAIAIFTPHLAGGRRWRAALLGGILLIQYGYMFCTGDIVTLKDARSGWNNGDAREVEKWLDKHYDGGYILVDIFENNPRFIDMHIPLKRFIHQGTRGYWEKAIGELAEEQESRVKGRKSHLSTLNSQPLTVRWIWMRKGDRVWRRIHGSKVLRRRYRIVFREREMYLYRHKETGDRRQEAGETGRQGEERDVLRRAYCDRHEQAHKCGKTCLLPPASFELNHECQKNT
ncbi:glycosyltransferase family 39 protein [Candidatus Poribacteria bacterium]|nr:glycosyltransferase family 39 protein [Candidatus Poribacteria bacterium]